MKKSKFKQTLGSALTIAATVLLSTANFAQGADYEWPKLLVIGTPGTATGSFASTNGWAPVLQKQVGAVVRVVPEDSESMRYRRLTEREDILISSVSAAEMRFQTEGIGGYAATDPRAMRIIWHHNDTPWSFVVSGDSDVTSMEDLKRGDVRLAVGVFSPAMTTAVRKAVPAYLGLTDEEAEKVIKYVPAGSYAENCRGVVEGKVDMAYCSPISSVLSEMEGAPGSIRWIPMPQDNAKEWGAFLAHRPMLVPSDIGIGVSTARGVAGATSNYMYSVAADADADFVYNMAKWFHTAYDNYKGTHPLAARMSLEQFRLYLNRSPMPVHEGTVKYLREVGAWTDEDDVWNQQNVERMNSWIEARKAGMAEAKEKGIEMNFENAAYLEILQKHTKDLEGFKSRL